MPSADLVLLAFMRAVARGDLTSAVRELAENSSLATTQLEHGATRNAATEFLLEGANHYVYAGDSALHIVAAAYRPALARTLVAAGAQVGTRNRRGAQPLHYAADGQPGSANWNPPAQAETITYLIAAGADPNAVDKSGVAPLHRAVRTRCAAAVNALLTAGADPCLTNGNSSTPLRLATHTTGRGGSGTSQAIAEQAEIVRLLLAHGAKS